MEPTGIYNNEPGPQEYRQRTITSHLVDQLHGRKAGVHDLGEIGGREHGSNHNRQTGHEADEHSKIPNRIC